MAVTVRQRIPRHYECSTAVTVRRDEGTAVGRTLSVVEDAAISQTDRLLEATPVKSVTPTRRLGVSRISAFAHPGPTQPTESKTIIPTRDPRHMFAGGVPSNPTVKPSGANAPDWHWSDAID